MHSVGANVSCSFGKRRKLEVRRDIRRKEKQTCDIFELYLSLIKLYAVDTEGKWGGGGGYLSLILRAATAVWVCCFPLYYFFWIVIGRILGVQGEFAAAVSRLLRCLEDMSRLCTDTTPFTLPPIFLLCFFGLGSRGGFEKREKGRM
jgi:hypothetical protein